jgi:hypothetical protein
MPWKGAILRIDTDDRLLSQEKQWQLLAFAVFSSLNCRMWGCDPDEATQRRNGATANRPTGQSSKSLSCTFGKQGLQHE